MKIKSTFAERHSENLDTKPPEDAYVFMPVMGVAIELVFYEPNPDEINTLMEWATSFTPSQGYIVRARRKFTQAFTKLLNLGFTSDVIAKVMDYIGNSYHLDKFEKIVNVDNVKEGYLVIVGGRVMFIKGRKYIAGNLLDEMKNKLTQILNSGKKMSLKQSFSAMKENFKG